MRKTGPCKMVGNDDINDGYTNHVVPYDDDGDEEPTKDKDDEKDDRQAKKEIPTQPTDDKKDDGRVMDEEMESRKDDEKPTNDENDEKDEKDNEIREETMTMEQKKRKYYRVRRKYDRGRKKGRLEDWFLDIFIERLQSNVEDQQN